VNGFGSKTGVAMAIKKIKMNVRKNIALIAHDNRKKDLLEWVAFNKELLRNHNLFATGTTGQIISKETGLTITRFQSDPLGGDQQVGAKITEGKLDFLIFFWDPLLPQPHDPDVKALLRIAVVWNIPVVCNRASADFMISSHLMNEEYERLLIDYEARRKEFLQEYES
jgi:methylglyoxal synthase